MITGEPSEAKIQVLPSPEMLVVQTGFIFKPKYSYWHLQETIQCKGFLITFIQ